jgi:hypothetical protein
MTSVYSNNKIVGGVVCFGDMQYDGAGGIATNE